MTGSWPPLPPGYSRNPHTLLELHDPALLQQPMREESCAVLHSLVPRAGQDRTARGKLDDIDFTVHSRATTRHARPIWADSLSKKLYEVMVAVLVFKMGSKLLPSSKKKCS